MNSFGGILKFQVFLGVMPDMTDIFLLANSKC